VKKSRPKRSLDSDDSEVVGFERDLNKKDDFMDQNERKTFPIQIFEDKGINGLENNLNQTKRRITITKFERIKIVEKIDPKLNTIKKMFQFMPNYE
jgi:hypothetical protein